MSSNTQGTQFDDEEKNIKDKIIGELKSKYFRSNKEVLLSAVVAVSSLVASLGAIYSIGKITYPEVIDRFISEGLTSPLITMALALVAWYVAVITKPTTRENFADIDQAAQKRIYEFRISTLQELLKKERESKSPLSSSTLSGTAVLSGGLRGAFTSYVENLIDSLDQHISVSEEKASKLLDKGTLYLRRGIYFYVGTIIVWQVLALVHGRFETYMIVGVVSCSLTFLVIEFLAAWFLKQYRGFIETASQIMRIKSIFNKIMLSYLAVDEFVGDDGRPHPEMRAQLMEMLGQDLAWNDVKGNPDVGHMVEMFQSVSGVIEKMKDVMPKRNSGE